MDWDEVKGRWKQFTGSVQQQWGQITGDEATEVDGDRGRLEGLIQERYGRTKDEARREVDDWLAGRHDEHHERHI